MLLPLRKIGADQILENYAPIIEENLGYSDTQYEILIERLEELKSRVEEFTQRIFLELGYEGSTVEENEALLNKRLRDYQKATSFLNGRELNDFLIKKISSAVVYSFNQQQYQTFLEKKIFEAVGEGGLKVIDAAQFARIVLDFAGFDTNKMTFKISTDGTSAIGYGGVKGSTPRIYKTLNYEDLPKKIKEKIEDTPLETKVEKVTEEGESFSFKVDENNLYSFLKLKATARTSENNPFNIKNLLRLDGGLEIKIRQALADKVIEKFKEHNATDVSDEFIKAVNDIIITKASITDIFQGGNASNNMTGLLGEIQGLYYMYVLFPNAKGVRWSATEGKIKPHADLVLETTLGSVGVQVKNTTKAGATQYVEFETFKTEALKRANQYSAVSLDFTKELDSFFSNTINENSELFKAATTLMGMEHFNVEYVWDKRYKGSKGRGKAVERHNPDFVSTRIAIEEEAKRARKAMISFVIGVMYMQLQPIQKNEANLFYLIGGSLIQTSASILKEIIENLKKTTQKLNFTFSRSNAKNSSKKKYTIADFMNETKSHSKNMQYILTSSYTFSKNMYS